MITKNDSLFHAQDLQWFSLIIPHTVVNSFLCKVVSLRHEVYQHWQLADRAALFPPAPYLPSSLAHASKRPHTVPLVVRQQYRSGPTETSADPLLNRYFYVTLQSCQMACNGTRAGIKTTSNKNQNYKHITNEWQYIVWFITCHAQTWKGGQMKFFSQKRGKHSTPSQSTPRLLDDAVSHACALINLQNVINLLIKINCLSTRNFSQISFSEYQFCKKILDYPSTNCSVTPIMHQIHFCLGICPGPHWQSLQCSPDPITWRLGWWAPHMQILCAPPVSSTLCNVLKPIYSCAAVQLSL